jgi:hypothetical protein
MTPNDDSAPYTSVPPERWAEVTAQLIGAHPLREEEIVDVVLTTWRDIFESRIGTRGYRIGVDTRPTPQIMGNYLHELIPLEFQHRYAGVWRRGEEKHEKDLVHIPDPAFSVEIKTSSHPTKIFGNRSYAQPAPAGVSAARKGKSGYYLAINFAKFSAEQSLPDIVRVRFGWLDYTDWVPQASATGQQASLKPISEERKLKTLFVAR